MNPSIEKTISSFEKIPIIGRVIPGKEERQRISASQEYLSCYAGHIALIGCLTCGEEEAIRETATATAKALGDNGVIKPDRITAVSTIAPEPAAEICTREKRFAEILSRAIEECFESPCRDAGLISIQCGPGKLVNRSYSVLREALAELEATPEGQETSMSESGLSFVGVVSPGYGAEAFGLGGYSNLNGGRPTVLSEVGAKPENNKWSTLVLRNTDSPQLSG